MQLRPVLRHCGPEEAKVLGTIGTFLAALESHDKASALALLATDVFITDDVQHCLGFGAEDAEHWLSTRWSGRDREDFEGATWVTGNLDAEKDGAQMLVLFNCRRIRGRRALLADSKLLLELSTKGGDWKIDVVHWIPDKFESDQFPIYH